MALFSRRAPVPPDPTDLTDPTDHDIVNESPPPPPPDPDPDPDDDLPPSRMRGTEPLYGYVVALELLVVAILNLVITTGAGAPAHPDRTLQLVGLLASLAFFPLILVRNRTVVGMGAIVTAFFVTLPRGPSSLTLPHVLALAAPLVYGLVLTQRQRRAVGNNPKATRSRDRAERSRERTDTSTRRRRSRSQPPPPRGPRASARYTPPKAKRTGHR